MYARLQNPVRSSRSGSEIVVSNFTLSANLAGIPGMSLPCGFSSTGLPIGLQLMVVILMKRRY